MEGGERARRLVERRRLLLLERRQLDARRPLPIDEFRREPRRLLLPALRLLELLPHLLLLRRPLVQLRLQLADVLGAHLELVLGVLPLRRPLAPRRLLRRQRPAVEDHEQLDARPRHHLAEVAAVVLDRARRQPLGQVERARVRAAVQPHVAVHAEPLALEAAQVDRLERGLDVAEEADDAHGGWERAARRRASA